MNVPFSVISRKVSHEDVLFLYFSCLFVYQTRLDTQRRGVGDITFLALFLAVLWRIC